jgi:hypothetical protein
VKLAVSFASLDALRRRIGAPVVQWKARVNREQDIRIDYEPREWADIGLDEVEVGPGDTITVDGRRVFLYIREFRVKADTFEEASNHPETLRKFHVAWCQALREMKAQGRFERYVASERVDEPFGVAMQTKSDNWICGDVELHVCRFCLTHLNWRSYPNATRKRRTELVESFSRRIFLETEVTRFAELPSKADTSAPAAGYAADWAERSRAYRASVRFRCEGCGVDCSQRQGLLDTHHQNGVTSDNTRSNLVALCKTCHARKHPNWYRVTPEDQLTLEQLRGRQGISG